LQSVAFVAIFAHLMSDLVALTREIAATIDALRFAAPVAFVTNPLIYARAPHELYLKRYGRGKKRAIFMGMNPGPFGMAQTGVPFGEVASVRDWLGIVSPVETPPHSHPKRPILGFDCPRAEVSGQRLWGWAKEKFGKPEAFFSTCYVHNYCPLLFTAIEGTNLTPDKLPKAESAALFAICDAYLRGVVAILKPEVIVGVGAFAQARASAALKGERVQIARIPHPSPASPAANRGWSAAVDAALIDQGLEWIAADTSS
jgi:single-strand selective monofunctional uracil DNA glycosylase